MNPQFARVPLLGQRPPQAAQPHSPVDAAIGQIALNVYLKLAMAHVEESESIDKDKLRQFAVDAHTVGVCYFEGIGAIKQEDSK
jgi:hypothetical protein